MSASTGEWICSWAPPPICTDPPEGGRHFECYSEDPFLSARLAVAYVRGVQSQGVGACIKHFVANDQEDERFTIDVQVDEQTLREVYLLPFEAAVKEAGVRAVMAAYNYVNGDHACAHRNLLVEVLKEEWGFDGIVVSDWWAVKDLEGPAINGLDIEMPGPGRHWGSGQLLAAVERGDVSEQAIDDKARRVLGFLEWRGRLSAMTDHEEQSLERPEHRALARRAAAESMVPLRNEESLLPLKSYETVALIGPAFSDLAIQGGGSASLQAHRTPRLLSRLSSRLGSRLVGHVRGPDRARLPARVPREWLVGDKPVLIELFGEVGFSGSCVDRIETRNPFKLWSDASALSDYPAISIRATLSIEPPAPGRYAICGLGAGQVKVYVDGELVADSDPMGFDVGVVIEAATAEIDLLEKRPYEVRVEAVSSEPLLYCGIDFRMAPVSAAFEQECQAAEMAARLADIAVVAVGSTAEWESESRDRDSLDLPARQTELVERVLAANPNTVVVLNCGAPTEIPWLERAKGVLLVWYPGQEGDDAIADVLMGDAEPGGRMPTTWARRESDTPSSGNYPGANGVVRYEEGLFVGYRHYDRAGIEPAIAFGHGLSYTTFEWGTPAIAGSGADWQVGVPVQNTGRRPGSVVVQIYAGPADRRPDRPDKQLAGFAKLHLDPGESGIAEIQVAERAFACWDVGSQEWATIPGRYNLFISAASTDTKSAHAIEVA